MIQVKAVTSNGSRYIETPQSNQETSPIAAVCAPLIQLIAERTVRLTKALSEKVDKTALHVQ